MGIPVSFDLVYKIRDLCFPLVFRVNVSTGAGRIVAICDEFLCDEAVCEE